jgi:predicted nucleotidyltransferase
MTITPQIREKLKVIVKNVKEAMPVSAIYLFGSYAMVRRVKIVIWIFTL